MGRNKARRQPSPAPLGVHKPDPRLKKRKATSSDGSAFKKIKTSDSSSKATKKGQGKVKGKGKAASDVRDSADEWDEEFEDQEAGLQRDREALFDEEDLVEPKNGGAKETDEWVDSVAPDEIESEGSSSEHEADNDEEEDLADAQEKAMLAQPILKSKPTETLEMFQQEEAEEDEDEAMNGSGPFDDSQRRSKGGNIPDLQFVKRRMHTGVKILQDWKNPDFESLKGDKSRNEITQILISDICEYYGYNTFLAEKLFQLLPIEEVLPFFDSSDTQRPVTIRTNTLKTKRRDLAQTLINRGVTLEPIGKWTKEGLQIFESSIPIGATPEYLAGHYILQSASSFLPVLSLSPKPNERILDMSSAPGGKVTHMSALMQNTGTIFANDSSKKRCKSLAANVARLGCRNVVVSNYDGREFPKVLGGFDRVLLDAPCSGTGVISKDQSVKMSKSDKDFALLTHLQKELLLSALDSVSPTSTSGGYVVYSTCSLTIDEDESVVDYALRKRPNVTLVETGLEFGRPGFINYRGKHFHSSLELTRRFWPHALNMDGFFVAKFKVGKPLKKNLQSSSGTKGVGGDEEGGFLENDPFMDKKKDGGDKKRKR